MKCRFLTLLILSLLACRNLSAQGYNIDPEAPQTFAVNMVRKALPNSLPDLFIYVTIETNKFVMRQLDGYRFLNDSAQRSIKLTRTDNTSSISFRILNGGGGTDASGFKQWVFDRYPGAKITEESSAAAANMGGPAFNLVRNRGYGIIECLRVAFIPSRVGILEFTLSSTSAAFGQAQTDLRLLLLSFRAEVNGKLKLPVRNNAS